MMNFNSRDLNRNLISDTESQCSDQDSLLGDSFPIKLEAADCRSASNSFAVTSPEGDHDTILITEVKKNPDAFWLLMATGSYWPPECEDNHDHALRVYFIFLRTVLFVCAGFSIFFGIEFVVNRKEIQWLFPNIANFVGFLLVMPAHFFNQQRLLDVARLHDKIVLSESFRVTMIFGSVAAFTVVFYIVVMFVLNSFLIALYYCGDLCVVLYLISNMFFLVMDLKASYCVLNELHRLADAGTLTLVEFDRARRMIKERVEISKWASDLVLLSCVLYCLCFVTMLYFYSTEGFTGMLILRKLSYLATLLKEMVFVAIAFWYVAKVNERADELTAHLADRTWGNYTYIDRMAIEPVSHRDLQRLSLYATSKEDPISFTLLFRRVSWKMVYLAAAGYAVALFLGIAKRVVEYFH